MRAASIATGVAWLGTVALGHWLAEHDLIAVALLRRDPLAASPLLLLVALRLFLIWVAPAWLFWALSAWLLRRRASRGSRASAPPRPPPTPHAP